MSISLINLVANIRGSVLNPTNRWVLTLVSRRCWEQRDWGKDRMEAVAPPTELAQEAGLKLRAVQANLKALADLGIIIWDRRTDRVTVLVQAVRDLCREDSETHVGASETHVGASETHVGALPLIQGFKVSRTSSPPAAEEGKKEGSMGIPGLMPEDAVPDMDGPGPNTDRGERKRRSRTEQRGDIPKEGTVPWLVRYFENESVKHGHPDQSNRVILHTAFKALRDDHGYTNAEIMVLLEVFFLRHSDYIRSYRKGLPLLFRSMLEQLILESQEIVDNKRAGRVSNPNVVLPDEMFTKLKEKNHA